MNPSTETAITVAGVKTANFAKAPLKTPMGLWFQTFEALIPFLLP